MDECGCLCCGCAAAPGPAPGAAALALAWSFALVGGSRLGVLADLPCPWLECACAAAPSARRCSFVVACSRMCRGWLMNGPPRGLTSLVGLGALAHSCQHCSACHGRSWAFPLARMQALPCVVSTLSRRRPSSPRGAAPLQNECLEWRDNPNRATRCET